MSADRTSATDVRQDFTYARHLMRLADEAMRQGITDLEESGEPYQIAMELVASAGAFMRYLDELAERQDNLERITA